MKTKVLIISALMAFIGCFAASAQQAATQTSQGGLTFNERIHDFGQINEADGRVKTIFEFVNDTNVPITMTNVQASCGCTVPEWSREPIAPKKKGYIKTKSNRHLVIFRHELHGISRMIILLSLRFSA